MPTMLELNARELYDDMLMLVLPEEFCEILVKLKDVLSKITDKLTAEKSP